MALVVGGAGWAWGLHPPQAPAARPPTAATHPRAWGRHRVSADEVYGAAQGGFQRPSSLRCVAAQDGGRREPQDHGEAQRAEEGGVGGWGEGRSGVGGGALRRRCMRRLSAPPLAPTPHASLSPGAVNSTSTLPSPRRSPRRRVARRRWTSPTLDSTRPSCTLELWTSSTGWRSSSSWRTPPLSQGRSAQHQSPCAGHALSLSSEGRFATVRPRLVAGLLHQKGCVKTGIKTVW